MLGLQSTKREKNSKASKNHQLQDFCMVPTEMDSPWGFTTSLNRTIGLLLKPYPPLHPCSVLVLATLSSPSPTVQPVVKGMGSRVGGRTCPFSVVTHG